MSNQEGSPPVRIIRKKSGHGGGHGGAWKVAYADFVTAMMALFIVLWIVGQNNQVKDSVAAYFKDPGAFSKATRSGGVLPGGSSIHGIDKIMERSKSSKNPMEELEKLKIEGKRIEGMISSVKLFGKFKDRIQIQASKDGLRIELIENSAGLFFDVGSANLKEETIQLLELIASEVGKLPNSVIIEGYTDARPFVSSGYSNWELSVDRANAARKTLEGHGLRKDQVHEVRGFADRLLRNPSDPLDFSNRRVSILVVPHTPVQPEKTPHTEPSAGKVK